MALETIIKREKIEPVLVDMPVEVEKIEEDIKPGRRIPWRLVTIGGGIGLFLLLIIGGIIWAYGRSNRPDLELKRPAGVVVETPTPTVLQTLLPVLSTSPYINLIEGFQITPPSGWVVDDSRKSGDFVVFLSPIPKVIDTKSFATLINVESQKTNNIGLDDQVNEIKRGIVEAFPEFEYENDLQLYLGGRPYFLIGGTYFIDTVKMRRRSLVTIYNNRGFAISATGPLVTWQDYEEVITASMYSFKLL